MHEMSIAEGVLQLIEDASRQQGFSQVRTIWVEVGQLSGVEPEALAFCFDAVTRGTLAEGARLEIVHVPGTGQCFECGRETPLEAVYDACRHCGNVPVSVTGGTEMRVKELEVD
jgi:hydrogenase nickel incorporation protein HypA/HybF